MTPPKGQRLGGRRPPEPTSTRTDPPSPTAPETAAETPVDASANGGQPMSPTRPGDTRTSVETPAEMDRYERARWRTLLQNSARKLAADRARIDESEQGWASTVAAARAAGVPANVLLAAAADADVELPE